MPSQDVTASEHQTPFERFEEFARKLVQVPKKELDEKLAAERSKIAPPQANKHDSSSAE